MVNNNLSYIIDYLYQKHIEKREDYIECIYDIKLLNKNSYMLEDEFISRVMLPKHYLKYKYTYTPYKLSPMIIKKLSKFIEITSNDFLSQKISENLIKVLLDDKGILYYDRERLLLNNSFDFEFYNRIDNQITTLDILIEIRRYYAKRN
jgi:hypothetical protein